MQLLENALSDRNLYRMYSTIVTEGEDDLPGDSHSFDACLGLDLVSIPPADSVNADQAILDIEQVRILSMSHQYNPSRIHAGLLIYSVDGETDFIINGGMMRIKAGDVLIHQTHHALAGQEELYRELIRTLFGTHRINLIGLVFTFSGNGQFTDAMRWGPSSPSHTTPMHPIERKLVEIVLVSLYMNHAWLSMPIASHVDMETLSQSAKKEYLLKLAAIEQQINKRRAERDQPSYGALGHFWKSHSHQASDSFRAFEWTLHRAQTFDGAVQSLLDEFYNLIEQTFPDGEFDRDQYAYYDDSTKNLMSRLVNPYASLTQPRSYS